MNMKKIVVAGGGVLGSQIALQSAFCGFDVTIWLRSEGSIERAQPKLLRLKEIYLNTLESMKTNPAAYCRGFSCESELSADKINELIKRHISNSKVLTRFVCSCLDRTKASS